MFNVEEVTDQIEEEAKTLSNLEVSFDIFNDEITFIQKSASGHKIGNMLSIITYDDVIDVDELARNISLCIKSMLEHPIVSLADEGKTCKFSWVILND